MPGPVAPRAGGRRRRWVAATAGGALHCLQMCAAWEGCRLQPGRARRAHLPFMCCPAPSLTHPLPDWLSCCAERWGRDWALLALAAADNTALCLEHYCDALAQ